MSKQELFHELLDFPHALPELRSMAEEFARNSIGQFPDLACQHPMPPGIWEEAGESSLLGIGIPVENGGQGGGYADIAAAGAEISFASACPGLALSVLLHHLTASFVIGSLGTKEQRLKLLPRLATGKLTASMAISEPGTGANPKGLRTKAEKTENGWILSGHKTFITNASLAGIFIVMAVTGEKDGKKAFSAFLVPAESTGLSVMDLGPLPFFRPAPHGEIRLDEIELPYTALLGEEGKALDMLAKTFRGIEDALMAGAVAGGLAALLYRCCRDLKEGHVNLDEKHMAMGLIQARIAGLSAMAARAAQSQPPSPVANRLNLAIRNMAAEILRELRNTTEGCSLQTDTLLLFKDMEKSGSIAGNVAAIRQAQMGKILLG
ncbi:acyl-CoA dehydrogenase family protein [Desulfobotulus mexicanus]|uniref:Acyl-CoA dehydrogenase n=1 Tax=Desulfobotulus mexicanus TaxID=2586642 RepID=A0A5S5MDJ5_9BACT|nr:acyl-CoA dehydrogenase family protein [Desulfobotulus mexicanus]TYT73695.1 acyl-CoA dehydrogenase [Desulfobotulus mexicanus]